MKRLCVALFLVLCLAPLAAQADFIPLPVKWSQLPVVVDDGTGLKHFIGVDYLSNHQMGVVVADDFVCDDPRPIVAVRWWGSYLQDAPGMVREVLPVRLARPRDRRDPELLRLRAHLLEALDVVHAAESVDLPTGTPFGV